MLGKNKNMIQNTYRKSNYSTLLTRTGLNRRQIIECFRLSDDTYTGQRPDMKCFVTACILGLHD